MFADVLNECSGKLPGKDCFFVVDKSLCAFINKQSDDAGAQIGDLFVDIVYHLHNLFGMCQLVRGEKILQ